MSNGPTAMDWAEIAFDRKLEIDRLRGLLGRCLPIIEADARMMADITRHSPLDAESQAIHDSTEYESEKLLREIPAALTGAADQPSAARAYYETHEPPHCPTCDCGVNRSHATTADNGTEGHMEKRNAD